MKKLKILEGNDVFLPDVDGVVNCMHNYCLRLNDKTNLTAIAPKNKKGYKDNLPYKVIRYKSMYVPILKQYYGFPNSDKKFKQYIEEQNFDIIHIHSPFGIAKFAIKLAKKKNIPIVATFHSNMRLIFRDLFKSKWIAEKIVQRLGKLYNQCDEVFVCTPIVAEQARSFGYTGKITCLPYGTELPRCQNIEELTDKANKQYNLKKDEFVFVHVGRVVKLKRIDFILRSLKLVKEKGINFKFYIIGKGFEMENLKKLTNKLGLNENVIFTGFCDREQMSIIYARANLLLFPSIYDNFGLVKVEASAYETPGVYIENTCAGYSVEDGVNGFISKNTEEDFANKICEATQDFDKLKKIGKNASRDLYINWDECTNKLYEKLNEVAYKHNKTSL